MRSEHAPQAEMADMIRAMGRSARSAQRRLALSSSEEKAAALQSAAAAIRADGGSILSANTDDIAAAKANGLAASALDRLQLDENRLEGICAAIDKVAALPDPVGEEIGRSKAPAGMTLVRRRIPIGVIGIVYESRPNVTADAAALCFRSGNAAILRGGSEAVHSNHALHAAFVRGLAAAGAPMDAVQLMPTQDRSAVGAMLRASGLIDMIVPRGGKSLVARVQDEARVPVLAHLDGVCHTYIHAAADPAMARAIAVNAKMRRTGICGATETLLVDAAFPATGDVLSALLEAGCELRGDARAQVLDPRIGAARDEDWGTEYLDAVLSVAVVDGLDAAMDHIAQHSSGHTEAIVTSDGAAAKRFLAEVDSAIVMHNASTQFADGGEFGLGAEIGIATGRLHARGPVALEGLTTYKWQVIGNGEVRG